MMLSQEIAARWKNLPFKEFQWRKQEEINLLLTRCLRISNFLGIPLLLLQWLRRVIRPFRESVSAMTRPNNKLCYSHVRED